MTIRVKNVINNQDFKLDIPTNSDDWFIIKEENYRPDRGAFILDKFNEDFPDFEITDVEKVYSLSSRSTSLSEWLAKQNLSYATIQNEPTFYRDVLDPDEFSKVSRELQSLSIKNRERAEEEIKASRDFKDTMLKISQKYSKFKPENKFTRVISMNSTELPLTLQLAIENYVPASSENAPTQKAYSRELLTRYKVFLINEIIKDKDVDIDKVINDSHLK